MSTLYQPHHSVTNDDILQNQSGEMASSMTEGDRALARAQTEKLNLKKLKKIGKKLAKQALDKALTEEVEEEEDA